MSSTSLQTSLGQQQTLAPQMRRSLEILQSSSLEIGQLIQQAMALNPTLEDANHEELEENEADEFEEDEDNLSYLNDTDDDWRDQQIMENRANPWSEDDDERRQRMFDSIVAPLTLQQHLHTQIEEIATDSEQAGAVEVILGSLDTRGYMELSLHELSLRFGYTESELEAALSLVQSLDPAGIGARDLRECLLLQLERLDKKSQLEWRIIDTHLENFAYQRFDVIAKSLKTNIESIENAAEKIRALQPHPASEFSPSQNPYIVPDVVIERDLDGKWLASLTNESIPSLRINDFYKDMLAREGLDNKARHFLREQIKDGRSLIHAISLRQETLLAICQRLIEHQSDFLMKGTRFLRPMTMNDLAKELELHGTTISRAVSGKFIRTPHGISELRRFFTTGFQTDEGEEISNSSVKTAIQALIEQEPQQKPLSDQQLMVELKRQGIDVARRTVAKYREQLKILPSKLRKRL